MKDDVEVQKKELVEFCKTLYKNNKCELEKLVEFESGYLSHDAVKWYTRNMCLYQLLNEALRIRNVELLVKFGFFITDIFKQLSATGLSETDECHFKVYHGQRISKNELNRLQKSIGGMLSFNSFLSTSKDRNVAVIFAGLSTDDFIAVIFEINIDRNIRDTKPYADIRQISFISEEEEILFMLGSAFRILKIDCATPDGLTTISLELCSENDQMYKDVFKHEKLKLNEDTELYHLAELLFRIGDYDLSKKYYEKYMQEHPEYSPLCKMNLAIISYQKYGSNIDVEQPAHLFDSIRKMAADHGIDKVAVEEALTRRFEGWIHHHRAIMYAAEEKYDLALLSQKKALEEQLKCSTSSLPAIATSFYNIGQYHCMLQNFAEALEYMHKALSIREKSLPATHHDLSATYFVLGCLYEQNGDYRLAHEYFTKALNIRRISTESTRIELQMCEESIKRVNKHLS
jgi:tetratricopeptide (TPR) repeat protein